MFRSNVSLSAGAAALLILAGCGGADATAPGPNPNPTPNPTPAPSVVLSVTPATLSLVAGDSGTITATIVRGGGFTGAVSIAATGVPTGVTISGGSIAAGATTADLKVVAAPTAAAAAVQLGVNGTASGVTIAAKSVAFTVTRPVPPPGGQIGAGIEGEMAGDQFGVSIALSANGSRVIVGAPYNDGAGADAGHARVFERRGTSWTQLGADLDGAAAGDRYGISVAISDNGNRVAVGSALNDGGGTTSGNVRVFDYTGGAWVQVGTDIYGPPKFGSGGAIAMSASGNRLIIGGSTPGGSNGIARVYELIGGTWTQVGADFTQGYEFGSAVTMSDDGNRVAISFPSASGSSKPGTTVVYDWTGSTWTLVGAAINGEAIGDYSGGSLSMSGDGSMLAIGARSNIGQGTAGGQVRVYRFTAGTWTQVGDDIDGGSGEGFGQSVSLASSGTRFISAGNDGGRTSIRVYTLSGSTWTKSPTPDFGTGGRIGAVAISADGTVAAIGEVYFKGTAGTSSGIVRLYQLP